MNDLLPSMGRITSAKRRLLLSAGKVMLLAAVATPAMAADQVAGEIGAGTRIVVTADRESAVVVEGIDAERSIDEDAIAAYSVGTIGEVIEQIAREEGDGGDPLLFVNGQPVADPGDITDYPAEAIERVDVLSRGASARLGAGTGRRAYNVVLKRSFGSVIGQLGYRFATEGGWDAGSAEVAVTRIAGQHRLNIFARAEDESHLLESRRDIVQPPTSIPFDVTGNLIADPRLGTDEIDPALNSAAGARVVIAPLMSAATMPVLGDFAAAAGQANQTNLGDYRTLQPAARRYDVSLNANEPITDWLSASVTASFQSSRSNSLQGLAAGLLVLPDESPLSPFSRDVAIARYAVNAPLASRSLSQRVNTTAALNAQRGEWLLSLRGNYNANSFDYDSARQLTSPGTPVLLGMAGSDNPFAVDIAPLLPLATERSRSSTTTKGLQLFASGPLASLPAGPLRATATVSWASVAQDSSTAGPWFTFRREDSRTEWTGTGTLEVPLLSPEMDVWDALGSAVLELDYGITDISDKGAVERSGYALRWEPSERLRLRAGVSTQENAPTTDQLGAAVTVYDNVRYYDPVRSETVDVRQTVGGNPLLRKEKREISRISLDALLVKALNMRLTGEYLHTRLSSQISTLPPAGPEILLAFPERFEREADGRLVAVDVRPVNFASHSSDQLRWGTNFNVPLSASLRPGPDGTLPSPRTGAARWQLQFNLNHLVNLRDRAVLREGLAPVDLLDGGALGYGGAVSRQQLDFSATLSDREVGLRLGGTVRGASDLNSGTVAAPTRLHFGPLATIDLRVFADLGQVLHDGPMLRDTKVTVIVDNIFNERQKVTDAQGVAPLHYQAGYRDPLGRTIRFELRRKF